MVSLKNKGKTERVRQRVIESYLYRNLQLSKLRRIAIENISYRSNQPNTQSIIN